MAINVNDLVVTLRPSEEIDRLVVWIQCWAEFLPEPAIEEFVAIMRAALKAEQDRP